MNAKTPVAVVYYNGKDISEDISSDLIELSYEDKVSGETDEISIALDDTKGLWRNEWYPNKGDKLAVSIGYSDLLVNCGSFVIDDIETSGLPAQVSIRGMAASVKKSLRTKKSFVHEAKTLKEIAKTIAQANRLTVIGEISDIRINRTTQNRETDLAFLRKLSYEYGYVFSVRDNQLVFTSLYDLDATEAVTSVDILEMSNYAFRDKLVGTYKKVQVSYHNVDSRKTIKVDATRSKTVNDQNVTDETSEDTLVVVSKAENKQQAEAKAKALLYQANTNGVTGQFSVEGNPLLVAGNNINITGLGALSGKYQIVKSSHRISISGYTTDVEVKRVGYVSSGQKYPAKSKAPRVNVPTPAVRQAPAGQVGFVDGFGETRYNI